VGENNDRGSVSVTKIEANRRNAQKSTGPKSLEGKQRSRGNAVKHGILADALLRSDVEDEAAFDELLAGLRRDFAPVGILEESLVEKIAICHLRAARALRCEGGLIKHRQLLAQSTVSLARVQVETEYRYEHIMLPEASSLDKILRYETSIHRQLVYAINQLERMQRARKGESVPAPVSVQLSSDQ
jgi:hypothetical protein